MYIKYYKDYNFSSSRAIAYYVNTHEIDELIEHKTMSEISKNYHNYLKGKKELINELDILSDSDNLNFKNEKKIDQFNDYSSNFNNNSILVQ